MENICLDPTDASEMHEKDHVFFTHLTTELIHLLPVLPENAQRSRHKRFTSCFKNWIGTANLDLIFRKT